MYPRTGNTERHSLKSTIARAWKRKFGFKVFVAFALFIIFVSLAFTLFFTHHQSTVLRAGLLKNGKTFTNMLAYTSRIGVYSGNKKLIRDAISGVLTQDGVLSAAIYDPRGNLLEKIENPSKKKRGFSFGGLNPFVSEAVFNAPLAKEFNDRAVFRVQITAAAEAAKNENLLFTGDDGNQKLQILGVAEVTLDKSELNRKVHSLMLRSVLLIGIFIIFAAVVTYLLAKMIRRPLLHLTEAVEAFGKEGDIQPMPTEREDEVGDLAKAFYDMTLSLKTREQNLKESRSRLRELSARVLKEQEKERRRISRELHDDLGQTLALLKMRVNSMGRRFPEEQADAHRDHEDASRYIGKIIESVRRLSRDLSPAVLEDLGLTTTLQFQGREFAEAHSIAHEINVDDIDTFFTNETQINLYRFFQESLTNISKHAQAKKIELDVRKNGGSVHFSLADDGKGFDVKQTTNLGPRKKGMGLTTLEERAHMMGGTLHIDSNPGQGTKINLTVPIEKE